MNAAITDRSFLQASFIQKEKKNLVCLYMDFDLFMQ